MDNLLTEALKILAANNTGDKPARDFMTKPQREALAEDFASKNHFLTAAHFTTDADKQGEFEGKFNEYVRSRKI